MFPFVDYEVAGITKECQKQLVQHSSHSLMANNLEIQSVGIPKYSKGKKEIWPSADGIFFKLFREKGRGNEIDI